MSLICPYIGVLDPITSTLTSYQDFDDLMEKCDAMFDRLDDDGSGGVEREHIYRKRTHYTEREHIL